MSQVLAINVNGKPLDLAPDEDKRFYLTKQVHDWINLETRNSDFTKTITIPTTDENRRLIGLEFPEMLRHTPYPSSFIPCEVLIEGIPMIEDAQLLVTTQNLIAETVSITIFGGATKFFSQLSTDFISALGWSEFDQPWNLSTPPSIAGQRTGITYGNNVWFSNVSLRSAISRGLDNTKQLAYGIGQPEIDVSGAWLFTHTVLHKIFSQLDNLFVDLGNLGAFSATFNGIGDNGQGDVNLVGGDSTQFALDQKVWFQFHGTQYPSQMTTVIFKADSTSMVLDIPFTGGVSGAGRIITAIDASNEYFESAFAVPNFSTWLKWQNPSGFYSQVRQPTGITYQQSLLITPLPFPSVVADDPGNWDVATNQYIIVTGDGAYEIDLTFVGNIAGYSTSGQYRASQISVINETNGATIGNVDIQDTPNGETLRPFSVQIKTSANLSNGDVLRVALTTGPSNNGTGKIFLDLDEHSINWSVRSFGSTTEDFFELSESLQPIQQVDFTRQIFALLNIVATETAGVVTLHYMGQVKENQITKNVAVNNTIELDSVVVGYGRNNIVKYATNDRVERLDGPGNFPMEAENIPKEEIKIESIFSVGDDQTAIGELNINNVSVPVYDIEYQEVTDNKMTLTNGTASYSTQERNDINAGDYMIVDPAGLALRRKVTAVLTDFSGEFDEIAPGQINDGNWTTWRYVQNDNGAVYLALMGKAQGDRTTYDGAFSAVAPLQYPVTFSADSVSFGRILDLRWPALLDAHFTIITDAMRRPFTVTAWFNISAVEFFVLNGMQMVYIPKFGAHFYVNKFEQWKFNEMVRLQLIKLEV